MASTFMNSFIMAWTFMFLILLLSWQVNAHGGHDHGDADGQNTSLRSKGLIAVKIYCLIILLFTTFAGGVSPYFYRWNESFLLLGTQFAGGIFLGTSMMHFLSDATETFGDLTEKSYPFSFMLASMGYVLTMAGDVVILAVTRRSERGGRVEEGSVEEKETGDQHTHPSLVRTSTFGDAVLLILALCFHSVFEGIAIGVADTKADAWRNLWTISLHKIFAAIAMGIALLRMLPKRPFLTTVAYSLAFAVSSPVGIGIGIAINATTQGNAADWIYAISMSLASGIFIYVAINHLIAKGFKPQSKCYFDAPSFRFLAVFVGIGVMAVVMVWD